VTTSDVELRPLTADLRGPAATFAASIPDQDKGFMDPFLFYQVAVSSWTQATPARRIAAVETVPEVKILGLVTVIPGGGWQRHVGEFRIVVLPDARGKGVGERLIQRGLALVTELGLRKTTIEIMASNAAGLALFERHGFSREAVLTRHVQDGHGALQDLVVLSREFDT
jgi:ribosomal protein S18 acetylase RimI-like enzyme